MLPTRLKACGDVPIPQGGPIRAAILQDLAAARTKRNDVAAKACLIRATRYIAQRRKARAK